MVELYVAKVRKSNEENQQNQRQNILKIQTNRKQLQKAKTNRF